MVWASGWRLASAVSNAGGLGIIGGGSIGKFAKKAEDCGVDAVVAEGFEAGGHNGREETTTSLLIPSVKASVSIPVIAAGGIYNGRSMLAAMILGADGVQMGTRFVASVEASSHEKFKNSVIHAGEGDTMLMMKKLNPVRLLKNKFYEQVLQAELEGASVDEMKAILGRARSKIGMFEGDLDEGELEIGQCASLVRDILPAGDIVRDVWREFEEAKKMTAFL
eukprot:gene22730-28886_t